MNIFQKVLSTLLLTMFTVGPVSYSSQLAAMDLASVMNQPARDRMLRAAPVFVSEFQIYKFLKYLHSNGLIQEMPKDLVQKIVMNVRDMFAGFRNDSIPLIGMCQGPATMRTSPESVELKIYNTICHNTLSEPVVFDDAAVMLNNCLCYQGALLHEIRNDNGYNPFTIACINRHLFAVKVILLVYKNNIPVLLGARLSDGQIVLHNIVENIISGECGYVFLKASLDALALYAGDSVPRCKEALELLRTTDSDCKTALDLVCNNSNITKDIKSEVNKAKALLQGADKYYSSKLPNQKEKCVIQ